MTDKARFLKALEHGPVCAVDFLAPDVIDGGKPITRLAARKYDLCADGEDVREIGKRHGCSVYALFRDGQQVGGSGVSPASPPQGGPERSGDPQGETPEALEVLTLFDLARRDPLHQDPSIPSAYRAA